LGFEVAAGFEVAIGGKRDGLVGGYGRERGKGLPECSAEEGIGVLDGVERVAEVDEVVFVFGVDPFFLKVIDEEMDVFGDKGRLDW
jgi:hypothetical protein